MKKSKKKNANVKVRRSRYNGEQIKHFCDMIVKAGDGAFAMFSAGPILNLLKSNGTVMWLDISLLLTGVVVWLMFNLCAIFLKKDC